jgi:hypothetical protein
MHKENKINYMDSTVEADIVDEHRVAVSAAIKAWFAVCKQVLKETR